MNTTSDKSSSASRRKLDRPLRFLRTSAIAIIVIGIAHALFWPARGQPQCGIGHEFNQCGGTADYRLGVRLAFGLGGLVLGAALLTVARALRFRDLSGSSTE